MIRTRKENEVTRGHLGLDLNAIRHADVVSTLMDARDAIKTDLAMACRDVWGMPLENNEAECRGVLMYIGRIVEYIEDTATTLKKVSEELKQKLYSIKEGEQE